MNERITELWDKAAEDTMDQSWESQTKFMERFAELIVRECVKVMYDNAIERKVGLDIDKRPTYYAAAILEHFGAKE
jgi:hypothetical protein